MHRFDPSRGARGVRDDGRPEAGCVRGGPAAPCTAAASKLVVSAPGAATAGSSFNVTVTAQDTWGNTVTGFNGSANLLRTDGHSGGTATISRSGGTATTAMTLYEASTLRLWASNGVIGGYGPLMTVSPAAMTVVVGAPATATAGVGFNVPITMKDAYGIGYSGPVTLTTSDGQTLNVPSFTMGGGYAVPVLVLYKADSLTLTAACDGTLGVSSAITILPA
jgi:hypothetical protein